MKLRKRKEEKRGKIYMRREREKECRERGVQREAKREDANDEMIKE
jgi:hypothetical protein